MQDSWIRLAVFIPGLSQLSHFFAPQVTNIATCKLNGTVCDKQISYRTASGSQLINVYTHESTCKDVDDQLVGGRYRLSILLQLE